MIVSVSDSGIRFEDMQTFTRFHIDANGLAAADFDHQVRNSTLLRGEAAESVIWVDIAALGAGVAESHRPDFDRMIAFATSKGWVSEDGTLVRGHIENLAA